MTRLNSMAIPTADHLRPRLDLPMIKHSPKDGFKHGSVAIPAPAPTQKRAADSLAALRPGDLPAPGDRLPPARSSSE
jgi:hypothetical protein